MKNLILHARILCSILLAASLFMARGALAQPAATGVSRAKKTMPPDTSVTLEFDKPSYFLGENVLAHFTVTNAGHKSLTLGDLSVTAQDSARKSVAAPYRRLLSSRLMMSYVHTIQPGQKLIYSLPLHRYLRFGSAGQYSVRVRQGTSAIGVSWRLFPIAEAKVNFVMPNPEQAKQVVDEMAHLPEYSESGPAEKTQPYADFSALQYPVYLPLLKQFLAQREDEALEAIGNIRAPEATQALVELLSKTNKFVADKADYWLAHRLPLTDSEKKTVAPRGASERNQQKEFAQKAWRPEFAPAVRAYARKQLLSKDHEAVRLGADAIERIGAKEDMPAVLKSFSANITLISKLWRVPRIDEESAEPWNIEQDFASLTNAAQALIKRGAGLPTSAGSPAEIAAFLSVVANNPELRPRDWESRQLTLLRHPVPFIRKLAIDSAIEDEEKPNRKSAPLSPALMAQLPRLLTDPDSHVIESACDLVAQSKEKRFLPTILRMFRTSNNQILLGSLDSAAQSLGARYPAWQIWAERLDEPGMNGIAIVHLMRVVKNQTSSGSNGEANLKTARLLKKQWQRFLRVYRKRLEAGQLFAVGDPALKPALAPPGYYISSGNKIWPPRR